MLKVYRDGIVGPPPSFPPQMEQRITQYLQADAAALVVDTATAVAVPGAFRRQASPAELGWLLQHATVAGPILTTQSSPVPLNAIREN
jgi:hypothetical protein